MFGSFPLWLNSLLFAVTASIIWIAGTYLENLADTIARRTKLKEAFIGVLILSAATSLPELATTVTAIVFLNNPTLAVYNLVGGVAFQTAIIVAADKVSNKGALTFLSPKFILLIESVGVILLLQLVIGGISAKGLPLLFGSVSCWMLLLFMAYIGIMYITYLSQGKPRWKANMCNPSPDRNPEIEQYQTKKSMNYPLNKVYWLFAAVSIIVLVAGWSAAQAADVLAEKTGLGSAFLGATLLALATSLPELSTTISASRNKNYSMAVSNVFGSNAFDISLLFLAEILYLKGSVVEHVSDSILLVASIGTFMTGIYLWGLLEHKDRTIFGVGWDSAANTLVYLAGMTVLYFMN